MYPTVVLLLTHNLFRLITTTYTKNDYEYGACINIFSCSLRSLFFYSVVDTSIKGEEDQETRQQTSKHILEKMQNEGPHTDGQADRTSYRQ
jgi:hypothetical protein